MAPNAVDAVAAIQPEQSLSRPWAAPTEKRGAFQQREGSYACSLATAYPYRRLLRCPPSARYSCFRRVMPSSMPA